MTKSMAEVLDELDAHRPDHREYEGGWWELACAGCDFAKGQRLSHLDWAPYRAHRGEVFAAALSAAGFGLVADAKRDAAAAGLMSVHDIWGSAGRSIVRFGELRDSADKILAGEWDRHIEWNLADIARERIRAAVRGEG